MTSDIQDLEIQKNTIYRDHYRIALKTAIMMVILSIILVLILCFQLFFPGKTKYFATTTTGELIPLFSLSEPVVSKTYLLQWASTAARASYNLDFDRYESELQKLASYFTPDAFDKFKQALKDSGTLDSIIKQKLDVSAIASNAPLIIKEFVMNGRHNWIVQVPLLLTLSSSSQTVRRSVIVTMRIQRVPVLNAEKGIQISDYSVVTGSVNVG